VVAVDAVDEGSWESEERSIASAMAFMSSGEVRERDMGADCGEEGGEAMLEWW